MKKYILGFLLVALVIIPLATKAATVDELISQIASLQAQLSAMQNQQSNSCWFKPDQDLSLGDGEDGDGLADHVSTLQRYLINNGYLNINKPTGWFGKLTMSAVKRWQDANNLYVTGSISRADRAVLCGGNHNNSGITINSVSGPTSLNVNQTGTWRVNATAPNGVNLTYYVDWGEITYTTTGQAPTLAKEEVKQTSTFTHAYSQAGTYTVKFTVRKGCAPCVSQGETTVCAACMISTSDIATASMTVTVGGQNNIITISGPNDLNGVVGKSYNKTFSVGIPHTINTYYTWSIVSGSLPAGLNLINRAIACSQMVCLEGQACPPCPNGSDQVIIGGVPTKSGWYYPKLMVKDNQGNYGYKVLKIWIAGSDTGSVTINSVSGPTSLRVNQTGTWRINATVPSERTVQYSVDWGDTVYPTSAVPSGTKEEVKQTSTFTHAYSQAGTYTIRFKVTMLPTSSCSTCENYIPGGEAESSMTVVVGGTSQNLSITYPADSANWHDYVGGNFYKTFSVVNPSVSRHYTWSITSGSLPAGLSMNTTSGVRCVTTPCPTPNEQLIIRGIPVRAGNFPFTLAVRDDLGNTGSIRLNINIEDIPYYNTTD